eukprot:gene3780-13848_t
MPSVTVTVHRASTTEYRISNLIPTAAGSGQLQLRNRTRPPTANWAPSDITDQNPLNFVQGQRLGVVFLILGLRHTYSSTMTYSTADAAVPEENATSSKGSSSSSTNNFHVTVCLIGYSLSFIIFGSQVSILGPTIGPLSERLGVDEPQLSPLFTALGISCIISGAPSGWLVDLVPTHYVLIGSLLTQSVGFALVPLMPSVWTLTTLWFIICFSYNFTNSAVFSSLTWMFPGRAGGALNLVLAMFGIGSFLIPLAAMQCHLHLGNDLAVFWIVSAVSALSTIPFFFAESPKPPCKVEHGEGDVMLKKEEGHKGPGALTGGLRALLGGQEGPGALTGGLRTLLGGQEGPGALSGGLRALLGGQEGPGALTGGLWALLGGQEGPGALTGGLRTLLGGQEGFGALIGGLRALLGGQEGPGALTGGLRTLLGGQEGPGALSGGLRALLGGQEGHKTMAMVVTVSCILLVFFSTTAETAVGNWINTYSQDIVGLDRQHAAWINSTFWGCFTLGRILWDRPMDQTSVLAMAVLSGMGNSAGYANAVALMEHYVPVTGAINGLFGAVAGGACMVGPNLVALLSSVYSTKDAGGETHYCVNGTKDAVGETHYWFQAMAWVGMLFYTLHFPALAAALIAGSQLKTTSSESGSDDGVKEPLLEREGQDVEQEVQEALAGRTSCISSSSITARITYGAVWSCRAGEVVEIQIKSNEAVNPNPKLHFASQAVTPAVNVPACQAFTRAHSHVAKLRASAHLKCARLSNLVAATAASNSPPFFCFRK